MNFKPILFSGPMVRALLDGTKTQTRRLVKFPARWAHDYDMRDPMDGKKGDEPWPRILTARGRHEKLPCPYGLPGDLLWVKENFHLGSYVKGPNAQGAIIAYAVGKSTAFKNMTDAEMARCRLKPDERPWDESRTIPCLLMPRWASRITLAVTGVRVERLQAISDEDAIAEGIGTCDGAWRSYSKDYNRFVSPVTSYRILWESINGPGSWALNPWVWVIQFERI